MVRTRQRGGTDEVQLIYITWQKSKKKKLWRTDRRERKRCLSTHISLPTNTPQLPSCSALPLTSLFFLLLFLFQVNVELMHCLFPPKDSVWGVLLTQPVFICRHLDPRVMRERGVCGDKAMKDGFKMFSINLNNFCPKMCYYLYYIYLYHMLQTLKVYLLGAKRWIMNYFSINF